MNVEHLAWTFLGGLVVYWLGAVCVDAYRISRRRRRIRQQQWVNKQRLNREIDREVARLVAWAGRPQCAHPVSRVAHRPQHPFGDAA